MGGSGVALGGQRWPWEVRGGLGGSEVALGVRQLEPGLGPWVTVGHLGLGHRQMTVR